MKGFSPWTNLAIKVFLKAKAFNVIIAEEMVVEFATKRVGCSQLIIPMEEGVYTTNVASRFIQQAKYLIAPKGVYLVTLTMVQMDNLNKKGKIMTDGFIEWLLTSFTSCTQEQQQNFLHKLKFKPKAIEHSIARILKNSHWCFTSVQDALMASNVQFGNMAKDCIATLQRHFADELALIKQ